MNVETGDHWRYRLAINRNDLIVLSKTGCVGRRAFDRLVEVGASVGDPQVGSDAPHASLHVLIRL